MTDLLHDEKHWRNRAEEARTVADGMNDPEARKIMLRIAADFDKLVARAEKRNEIRQ